MEVEHMYFVDRSKIRQTVTHIDHLLTVYDELSIDTVSGQLSLERLTHVLIESIIDVGNMMIDGFIMRDPGSYEDIIDILVDEKVIPEQDGDRYKAVIRLRDLLVRDYLNIDHQHIQEVLKEHKDVLKNFSSHVHTYLNNELGVVNAFANDEKQSDTE